MLSVFNPAELLEQAREWVVQIVEWREMVWAAARPGLKDDRQHQQQTDQYCCHRQHP